MVETLGSYTGLLLGIVVGALFTVAIGFPRVGRALGKIAAIALLGAGCGLLVWGLISQVGGDFESLQFGTVIFYNTSQVLGWGSGCLAAGITALVLSLVGKPKGPGRPIV